MDLVSGMSHAWPLIGRADELELVERAIARSGGAGVVVAGAPGVGKTRLARCVLERAAARGCGSAWVQATGSAGAVPFGAFAHLLPAELSHAGPVNLLGVAGQAVASRAIDGRLVLGVDDAHLLDPSSAALVRHLATSDACFVLVTVRIREPAPDAIVSLWKDGVVERIDLQPLAEQEVAALVRSALGGQVDGSTQHRRWELSGGNPLYLRELVLGGLDSGLLSSEHGVWRWCSPTIATPRLVEVVASRLGDLTADERRMLEIVAQAEPLEAAFLDALSDAGDRESVERRGLLETVAVDRRRTVCLSHPLYAEALRAATPMSRVDEIWGRLAAVLEASGARRAGDVLRLASWRLRAGDSTDTQLFVTAAREAVALLDFALAERLARAALTVSDSFEARFVLATALVGLSQYDVADSVFAELERDAANDEQRARAALRRSDNLYGPLGRGDEALDVLARGLDHIASPTWRDALISARARQELFGGSARDALSAVEHIVRRTELEPEIASEVVSVATWGGIVAGRVHDALAFNQRLPGSALEAAGRYATTVSHIVMLNQSAGNVVLGDLLAAERISRTAHDESTTHGGDAQRAVAGFAYGWVLRVMGRLRRAIEVFTDSSAVLRDVDFYRQYAACLGELAHCYAMLGESGAARRALDQAQAVRVPAFVMDYWYVTAAAAWTAYAEGELAAAQQLARDCAAGCASYGQTVFEAFAWHDLARLGDPAAALEPLRELAGRVDGELIPTFADHVAALTNRDAASLQRVARSFKQMGAVLYAAEAAAAAAHSFRSGGRTGSALTMAVSARRLIARCDDARTPLLDGLDATLPLTAREHEIAVLAARGLSNRNIAAREVLSVRTVDNHLHNAYTKLGITRRAELAAILLPVPDDGDGS